MPSQTEDLVHDDDVAVAADFLDYLRENSLDPPGVSRASFGPGERMAHARLAEVARGLGLALQTDFVGNLFVTQPGWDPSLPVVMIGPARISMLCRMAAILTVLQGSQSASECSRAYGGAARVLLMSRLWLSAPRKCPGSRPTIWQPRRLRPAAVRRARKCLPFDSGRSLASHMTEEGFEPEQSRQGRSLTRSRENSCLYRAAHRQGPVLVDAGIAVEIVTGIRGNVRYRHCSVRGTYGHAGAVPRVARRDVIMAATALVAGN